ncbi:MAG: hypothetical protein KIH08_09320 [Candidatus Freyarchaeota archaeon]|nr:hypothetical protein [Candidatus Jordarchaeia archaeon]
MQKRLFNEAISRKDFIEAYRIAKYVLQDEKKACDLYTAALGSIGKLIQTGMDLKERGDYEEAAKLFLRCAEFFEGERDYGRASGFFIEVGDCFSATNNANKARDSFVRGYELAILDWKNFNLAEKIASLSVLLFVLTSLINEDMIGAKKIFNLVRSSLEEKERRKLRRQDYYWLAKQIYTSLLKESKLDWVNLKNMQARYEKTDFLTLMQDLSKSYYTVNKFLEKFQK